MTTVGETPNAVTSRRQVLARCFFASLSLAAKRLGAHATGASVYPDGRPASILRLDATDSGPIIRHGEGPDKCDYLGAREAICFQFHGTYYLHYDGAGPTGWRACLAVSGDLKRWELKGPVLDLGETGTDDAGTASSPWTVFDGKGSSVNAAALKNIR